MIVNINNEERIFDDTYAKWINKFYQGTKIWYMLFCFLCILHICIWLKYSYEDDGVFLIMIPFFHIFVGAVLSILATLKKPNGDNEYIKNYYPEIASKIQLETGKKNNFAVLAFLNGSYIDFGTDIIIDEIRDRKSLLKKIIIIPFVICIINAIVTIFAVVIVYKK
ncbi:MAG: hypothetical protein Ta2B_08810 [Termitinemataceae bacterium]|nr:MAG: hypothetical protein Ta2B_08810 [Termitinemataceae bacterium]